MATMLRTFQAMITGDGHAVHVGEDRGSHPVYGTPSFEIRTELPLRPAEAALYGQLTAAGAGVVRLHIRSALAQLGVDAFHPETTSVRPVGNMLRIDSLVTAFNGDWGDAVIHCMRRLARDGRNPRIMHAGFFVVQETPHEDPAPLGAAVIRRMRG